VRGSKTVRWEVEEGVVRDEVMGSIPQGWRWSRWRLIDVELITKVMEELVGKTGQSAGGGEREVGGNEKVGHVLDGDFAGDGAVVSGRASVTVLLAGESQRNLKTACSMRGLVVPR
jgi:hypothetical protein